MSYRTFNLPPLTTNSISRGLISLFLKRRPALIARRMLASNDQADVENLVIESESDSDATLVALPLSVKELDWEVPTTTANVEHEPSVILSQNISDNTPDYSDDEDDSVQDSSTHDEPTVKAASGNPPPSAPPVPIQFWSPRNEIFDGPDFEIVKEDHKIVYATALSPPPWHRPKENMLIYEPAGADDDVRGEPVRDFSW